MSEIDEDQLLDIACEATKLARILAERVAALKCAWQMECDPPLIMVDRGVE